MEADVQYISNTYFLLLVSCLRTLTLQVILEICHLGSVEQSSPLNKFVMGKRMQSRS